MDTFALQHPRQQRGTPAGKGRGETARGRKISQLYDEAKTIVKKNQRRRWLQQHPDYNNRNSYYQLSREDKVVMVRLGTGQSRLRHHMFTKFRIGESTVCHCGTSPMIVEHFLQDCQTHQNLRAETWPADTPVREKIYGPMRTSSVQQHTSELPEFLSERTTKKKYRPQRLKAPFVGTGHIL